MLKMVDGTGIIGVDMICPLGVSTPQPPNYDRVEMEGTGILVLPNSLDAPLERLELGGKTEQVQTSGKNLFNGKILAGKYPADDMNIYEDKPTTNIFDKPVEIKPDTEYIISADGRLVEGNIYIYDEAGKKITEHYSGKFTSPSNAKYVVASGSNTYMTVNSAVQIEYGSTISSYEPYTGGKPSPSPEYPQEIKNVGKWNEGTQKYEVDVKITGKNLFDMNKFIDTCNFTKNEDGTFGIDNYVERYDCFIPTNTILSIEVLKVEDSSGAAALELFYEDGKSMYIGFSQVGVKTFLIQKDVAYIKVLAYRNHEYKYIQLEKGNTATPYEPYKEQTLTITSDRPITKWDRLVEQGGQIGWLYGGKKSILNEKTSWGIFRIDPNEEDNFAFTTNLIDSSGGNQTSLCKTFKNANYAYAKEHRGKYGLYSGHEEQRVLTRYFRQPNESVRTIEQWKEWLINNPIELWYESKTSEFVPLPQSEQNAIRALKTYYPTTVITVDGGEVDPDIKVTYRKEI